MNPAADIWAKVLALMQNEMTTTTINTWFDDTTAVELEGDRFVLYSPTPFKRDIIASRYLPAIQNALRELFSAEFQVTVLTEGELDRYQQPKKNDLIPGTEEYTFERFVVGSSNKFAHAAARAVAEALGAESLVFLTDVGGILIDSHNSKTAVPHMDVKRAEELIDTGLIAGGMVPKVRGCIQAIRAGVGEVSILDGRVEHALLLEMLNQRVQGTTITG